MINVGEEQVDIDAGHSAHGRERKSPANYGLAGELMRRSAGMQDELLLRTQFAE